MLKALYASLAAVAVLIGVLGLLPPSWLRQMLDSWVDIHALFGLLLCGLVFARYRWRIEHSPRTTPADVRELSRDLSRTVYLWLYLVIGLREIFGVLHTVGHSGAVDFNLFDDRFRDGPDSAGFDPKNDFQLFLAAGLITLGFVRVLAFRLWLVTSRTREWPP